MPFVAQVVANPVHTKPIDTVFEEFSSSEEGLTSQEVTERQLEYGLNEIKKEKGRTIFDIFVDQFRDILIWILIIAATISGITGEVVEMTLIIVIVVLNSVFGVYQEWNADKAIEALKAMTEFQCRVIREGNLDEIYSKELVPGDLLVLEQGDRVAADARLIDVNNLKVEEAALTGESQEITKQIETIEDREASLGDRKNMIFMGTFVTAGQGRAVVTSTAMQTQMGIIAQSVQEIEDEKTPFQIKIEQFGKNLGYIIIVLSIIIIFAGIFIDGEDPLEMVEIGISLAVAAIPEGLPIIITLVLAIGVTTMARQNSIIKRLPVVESLGSATVIATDKTGTLTKNEMTVMEMVVFNADGENDHIEVTSIHQNGDKRVNELMAAAILCNNGRVTKEESIGDPTETALLRVGFENGIDLDAYNDQHPRLEEVPFDSTRKRMNVLVQKDETKVAYMKGAPEIVLGFVNKMQVEDKIIEITPEIKQKILEKMENMAGKALRVLAFAYLETGSDDLEAIEDEMIFVGYMGMIDPPKNGVKEAIAASKTAGIRVIMVTGDHRITATAIGNQIGLDVNTVVIGKEVDKMSDDELQEQVQTIDVFARISPVHKLRIVRALKANEEIVSMTGDGVNDAPALKGADIGIAMGIQGTDVTKESADMILSDDNFASIIGAVEEGRSVFDNMTRFIRYTLSSNLAEILVVFIAILLDWKTPLLAIHILWINLVTDGLPALAMSREPKEDDIMLRPPRDTQEPILNQGNNFYILRIGFYITFVTLLLFRRAELNANYEIALTIAFSTLAIAQLFNAFNTRHEKETILDQTFFKNFTLIIIVVVSIFIQIFLVHGDQWLQGLFGAGFGNPIGSAFHTVPLTTVQWVTIFAVAVGTVAYEEIFKFLNRRFDLDSRLPNLALNL